MFVVFMVFSCDCLRSFLVEKVFGFFMVCEGFLKLKFVNDVCFFLIEKRNK